MNGHAFEHRVQIQTPCYVITSKFFENFCNFREEKDVTYICKLNSLLIFVFFYLVSGFPSGLMNDFNIKKRLGRTYNVPYHSRKGSHLAFGVPVSIQWSNSKNQKLTKWTSKTPILCITANYGRICIFSPNKTRKCPHVHQLPPYFHMFKGGRRQERRKPIDYAA